MASRLVLSGVWSKLYFHANTVSRAALINLRSSIYICNNFHLFSTFPSGSRMTCNFVDCPLSCQISINHPIQMSNVTSVTEVRRASARLFAGTWRLLVSLITALLCCDSFHRRVWYRALSLRYECTRSSGIVLIS